MLNSRVSILVARIASEGVEEDPLDVVTVARHVRAGFEVVRPHSPRHGEDGAGRDVCASHRGDVGGVVLVELGRLGEGRKVRDLSYRDWGSCLIFVFELKLVGREG